MNLGQSRMKSIIHDITDPRGFLPSPTPWWQTWWGTTSLAVTILLVGLFIYFTFRKKSETKRRKTLLDHARDRLEKLKIEANDQEPQTIAVRISLIIRQYLEAAFEDPALFETNEEFTLRPHVLEKLHPDSRKPVANHLTELSQLKYAPAVNTQHISSLIDQAGEILANIEINIASSDSITPIE